MKGLKAYKIEKVYNSKKYVIFKYFIQIKSILTQMFFKEKQVEFVCIRADISLNAIFVIEILNSSNTSINRNNDKFTIMLH